MGVEIGDPADHGRAGDEMVGADEQVVEQCRVAAVSLDETVGGVGVVGPLDRAVLREVVDPDDLEAPLEQLLDHISADEAGGPAHQNFRHFSLSDVRVQQLVQGLYIERGPNANAVPAQVSGHPFGQLEVRHPKCPVEPDGRHLGHRQPQPPGLGHQLEPYLEALVAVDADFLNEMCGRTP